MKQVLLRRPCIYQQTLSTVPKVSRCMATCTFVWIIRLNGAWKMLWHALKKGKQHLLSHPAWPRERLCPISAQEKSHLV